MGVCLMTQQLPNPSVLASWKEIAQYMGAGVRTVQRWERNGGLPVHRPKAANKGPVLAYPAELTAWVSRHSKITQGGSKDLGRELIERAFVLAASWRDLRAEMRQLRQEFQQLKTETSRLSGSIMEQRRTFGIRQNLPKSKHVTGGGRCISKNKNGS
jgi:hypothetical protein